MENDAALAEEAPLTLQDLPFWVLFVVIFTLVTFVGAVLIAATSLLSSDDALSRARSASDRGQVRDRAQPHAARHLAILPPAHS
ncbi:MAG TPA: hypothetical protein VFE13_10485 [Caulobacteraceae bacterium]|jgi:hypothetical protein|nr:hypothetical protein [Caulobacteraceae bacterium]